MFRWRFPALNHSNEKGPNSNHNESAEPKNPKDEYMAEQKKRGETDVLAERGIRRAIAIIVGKLQNYWKKVMNIRSTGRDICIL